MNQTKRIEIPSLTALKEVDHALRTDDEQRAAQRQQAAPQEAGGPWMDSLPALLRLAGAIVLIAAAAVFMLQHWENFSHVQRYYSFLGFTLILAAAGFFCGLRLHDDKSARTFLIVSAAVIPVHFTQLGGLLFSRLGTPAAHYPQWLYWRAPDDAAAFTTTAIGLAALIPVAYIAFSVLARAKARRLTAAYLAANAALLIPVRSPNAIGPLAFGLLALTLLFDYRQLRGESALRTLEGALVRTMLYVPFALLIGRTLHLYELSVILSAALVESAALVLFFFAPHIVEGGRAARFCQGFGTALAGLGWLLLGTEIADALALPSDAAFTLLTLPAALIFCIMGCFAQSSPRNYLRAGALTAAASVILQQLLFGNAFSSSVCIIVAILTAAYGHSARDKRIFYCGLSAFVLGMACNLRYAVEVYTLYPWLTLAAIGVLTVLAAAFLERRPALLRKALRAVKN